MPHPPLSFSPTFSCFVPSLTPVFSLSLSLSWRLRSPSLSLHSLQSAPPSRSRRVSFLCSPSPFNYRATTTTIAQRRERRLSALFSISSAKMCILHQATRMDNNNNTILRKCNFLPFFHLFSFQLTIVTEL